MNECKLYNGDCLTVMDELINDGVQVDMILADPPYGCIKGLELRETSNFTKEQTQWDNIIPIKPMYDRCYELLKDNHNMLLFCDNKYSFQLYNNRMVSKLPYLYKYYWLKQNFANQLGVNIAPVNYIEEIFVFKKINSTTENQKLREYAQKIWKYIGLSRAKIERTLGNYKCNHFFRFNGVQFSIPSRVAYEDLTRTFNLQECEDYLTYDEMLELKEKNTNLFKLQDNEKYKSNVLRYDKTYHGSLHPTQKPVPLLKDLIQTYTNEGDTVLDFTMGSGSTGVACMETDRKFIGIELDKHYYHIAEERLKK